MDPFLTPPEVFVKNYLTSYQQSRPNHSSSERRGKRQDRHFGRRHTPPILLFKTRGGGRSRALAEAPSPSAHRTRAGM